MSSTGRTLQSQRLYHRLVMSHLIEDGTPDYRKSIKNS
jgi:hypothetical protein